jgi:hypothetical protein
MELEKKLDLIEQRVSQHRVLFEIKERELERERKELHELIAKSDAIYEKIKDN